MASNLVVARGGVEFVPPISLAFWRWTVVFFILLPFTYLTLKKNFNVIGIGTIAIGTSPDLPVVGAALTVQYSVSTPDRLYYGLSKGGFISTADTQVANYSELRFIDSEYSGEYQKS